MYHSDECWRCCSCCCCCWTFCVLPPINQQQSSLSLLCRRIRIHSRSCSFVVVIRCTIIVHKHTRLNTHIFCMYHRTHMRRLSALFEHSFTVYLLGKRTIPTNGMTDRRTDRASERQPTIQYINNKMRSVWLLRCSCRCQLFNEWMNNGMTTTMKWWRQWVLEVVAAAANATTAITTCWICRQ